MAKRNTDLKFSTIKKQAKENNAMETYTFDDETTLKFYPIFPPTQIEQMFEEMQQVLQNKSEDLTLNDKMTYYYVLFLCIKHFTHLKGQLKATTLVGQLNEMNSLIDSGYFSKIVEDVFLPSETQKVFDQLSKISSNYLFLEKMSQKMRNEVADLELKNRDLLSKASK